MRDPNRIPDILARIHVLWNENPDLRLMQLLVNAIKPDTPCPGVYYMEDDKLSKMIEEYNDRWKLKMLMMDNREI